MRTPDRHSIVDLARRLRLDKDLLLVLAGESTSHYRAFVLHRPGKKPREIDNPDEALKLVQRRIRRTFLAPPLLPEGAPAAPRRARRGKLRSDPSPLGIGDAHTGSRHGHLRQCRTAVAQEVQARRAQLGGFCGDLPGPRLWVVEFGRAFVIAASHQHDGTEAGRPPRRHKARSRGDQRHDAADERQLMGSVGETLKSSAPMSVGLSSQRATL
jgi:hypothetical protein